MLVLWEADGDGIVAVAADWWDSEVVERMWCSDGGV